MKKLTRMLTVLLMLLFALCLKPADAFAATTISSVSLNIEEPKTNGVPSYYWMSAESGYYRDDYTTGPYENGVKWLNAETDSDLMPGQDLFKKNTAYTIVIYLNAEDGYQFGSSCTARVNGKAASAALDNGQLLVKYTFDKTAAPVSITAADIRITAPRDGSKAEFGYSYYGGVFLPARNMNDDPYENGVSWINTTDNEYLRKGSRFQGGKVYKLTVILQASGGYEFVSSCPGTVNGVSASTTRLQSGAQLKLVYTFDATPVLQSITRANLVIDWPVAGAAPKYDLTVVNGSHVHTGDTTDERYQKSVGWRDTFADRFLATSGEDKFAFGRTYELLVWLEADEGYKFDFKNVKVLINGRLADVQEPSLYPGTLRVTYRFTLSPINSVSATISAPKAGAYPSYQLGLPNSPEYRNTNGSDGTFQNGIEWKNETAGVSLTPGVDRFEAGNSYSVTVYLESYAGDSGGSLFIFDKNDLTVRLNGNTASWRKTRDGIYFVYRFDPVEDIPEAPVISAAAASKGIKISWKAVEGADGYYVYRKAAGSSSYRKISTTSGTSCTNTKDLVSGKKYSYYVYAYKTGGDGTVRSAKSNVKSRVYLARPVIKLAKTSSGIKVSWSAVEGAERYMVYRKAASESSYTRIGTTSKLYLTDTKNLKSGVKYSYKVYAVKTVSGTDWKSYASAVKSSYYLDRPVITLSKTSSSVKVSWSRITGAESYVVYRKAASESSYTRIGTTAKLYLTDTKNLRSGVKYSYKVYAVKTVGGTAYKSYPSAVKSITK